MTVRREDLLRVLQDAHAFYQQQVRSSWVPDHLNRRNLYPQLQPAQIGYAPDGWAIALGHLRSLGHRDDTLLEAGVAHRTRTGHLIDFFRDRLMVPLRTAAGELVGFIGRCPEGADVDVPKYLNSPQSTIFSKHQLLYGLGESSDQLRRGSMPVIVEGPMDRLAISQAARNVAVVGLAPCGTALTAEQIAVLVDAVGSRRAVAIALDPDAAGRHATVRAWELLTAGGISNLLHVRLRHGHDPAELLRRGRGDWLRSAIAHSRPLALSVADQRIAEVHVDIENSATAVAVARHIVEKDLRYVPARFIARYLNHLATQLHLDSSTMTIIATDSVS